MASHITLAQAFEQWNADIKPAVIKEYGRDDYPALSESWNDYTDSLCKEGALNDLQYHHAPAWDDDIPDADDEPAFILESMGVSFAFLRINERPDSLMSDMPAGSSHWRVLIKRGDKEMTVHYSMGPAHVGIPEAADVFNSLLMDTSDIDGEAFEDWAENLGYDPDSRKAERIFKACQETALHLQTVFTRSELDDLREIFADL
ncbi:hypothetical protein AH2_00013 [Burkholderia phage vB_BceS_AH2]|uniref:Uncharacterized protein n=1 Tax=Burkholderia phage vB_BceS_AH2 TaxID=1133022 RepID=I6NTK9_9CAUD|nr:hypothetical protein B613_gp13 [Burkholderia phage vB_BceS_AH2]AEY69524.1 hypothetical protein AH2_00013 [Burkholderia phage vB_BceS_AH2]